jgi:hypothetical protein
MTKSHELDYLPFWPAVAMQFDLYRESEGATNSALPVTLPRITVDWDTS